MGNSLSDRILCNKKFIIIAVLVCRLVVGGTYVFSGLTKAVDPWGTVYKIEDYFNVWGMQAMLSYSTICAFLLFSLEFTFGVFILVGCYRRSAPLLMLLSMVLFLPVTGWLAITDAVADCGCFGDALHLSNGMTFLKNVVLTLLLTFLLIYNKRVKNIYGFAVQWIVCLLSMSFVIVVSVIGYVYQPMIDFLPFKVGNTLVQDSDTDENNYVFIYEKDGEVKKFFIDSLPDDSWNFVDRESIKPVETSTSLSISENGEDITAAVLSPEENRLLILFPNLKDVDISYTYKINEITNLAKMCGIGVVGLTSASEDDIAEWQDISMSDYRIYNIDDSILKQLARGNPALVYLSDGKIVWKRAMQSVSDDIMSAQSFDSGPIQGVIADKTTFYTYLLMYVGAMIVLLMINRTHKVIKFSFSRSRRKENNT